LYHTPTAKERGGPVDPDARGSGFGLSIVRDILNMYGRRMRLEHAITSGLRMVLAILMGEIGAKAAFPPLG